MQILTFLLANSCDSDRCNDKTIGNRKCHHWNSLWANTTNPQVDEELLDISVSLNSARWFVWYVFHYKTLTFCLYSRLFFEQNMLYCFYYQRWIAWCLLTSFQNFLVLFPNTALHIYTDVERFSTVQHFDAFSFQIVFKRQWHKFFVNGQSLHCTFLCTIIKDQGLKDNVKLLGLVFFSSIFYIGSKYFEFSTTWRLHCTYWFGWKMCHHSYQHVIYYMFAAKFSTSY